MSLCRQDFYKLNIDSLFQVKKQFLLDLINMCRDVKENRRTILQMSVWQDWLISLTYIYPTTDSEVLHPLSIYDFFRKKLLSLFMRSSQFYYNMPFGMSMVVGGSGWIPWLSHTRRSAGKGTASNRTEITLALPKRPPRMNLTKDLMRGIHL